MTAAQSPTLERVLAGNLCAGCGLCAGISDGAVEMRADGGGYNRPVQSAPIAERTESVIAASCPGSQVAPWSGQDWHDAANIDPYWGPWHRSLTGHAVDGDVRYQGSSGGAISALAMHALNTGDADAVIHVGADPVHPSRNLITVSQSSDEVLTGAGSRYASSSPLRDIDALLATGQRYVFVGKPCDVSALRMLSLHDARVDAQIPLKLSFFCGGVPSERGAERIVRAMRLDPDRLTFFRYRGQGWPGLTRAEDASGAVGEMRYEDSWGSYLSKEVQFRCKLCPDAVGGVADIACADAWYGGETGYPQFEEADGRSLILTRTSAGERAVQAALNAGVLAATDLPIGEIHLMQPSQARRKRRIHPRLAACLMLLRPIPRMRGLELAKARADERLPALVKEFLGTLRRIVLKWF